MKKTLAVLAFTLGAVTCAQAHELYSHVGTEGVGLGYGHGIDNAAFRVEVNAASYSKVVRSADVTYDAKLKLSGAGLYGDWFAFRGAFRVTTGLTYNDKGVSGIGRSESGTVSLNGVDYSGAGEALHASVKYPKFMPYVGIGWGHNPTGKGWGVSADIGVMAGKPKTTLFGTPGLEAVAAGDIEAERLSIQGDVDAVKFFPVIKVGVTYRF